MILLLLFFSGLLAGLVDAIAGGGGLITIPVLMSTGMSPSMVLGTNKLQSSVGTLIAASHFHRRGFLSLQEIAFGLFFCSIGALIGARVTVLFDAHFFKVITPYLLLGIVVYMIVAPRLTLSAMLAKRLSATAFYVIFGLLLGFYDGVFGPGTGSFWMFAFMFFLGFDILKATAHTKIFNLTSNVVALIFFIFMQRVDYQVGLCMAAGQVIGGYIGARLAIYKGAKLIRPLFLTTVFVTVIVMFRAI